MKANTLIVGFAWLLLLCSILNAFEKGDRVVVIKDAPASFYDKFNRTVQAGQHLMVETYDPETKRIFFLSRDENGQTVGLNISQSDVILDNPISPNQYVKIGSLDLDAKLTLLRAGGHDVEADALETKINREAEEILSGSVVSDYKTQIYATVAKHSSAPRSLYCKTDGWVITVTVENTLVQWEYYFYVGPKGDSKIYVSMSVNGSTVEGIGADVKITSPMELADFKSICDKFLEWDVVAEKNNLSVDDKPINTVSDYGFGFIHSDKETQMSIRRGKASSLLNKENVEILRAIITQYDQLKEAAGLKKQTDQDEQKRVNELLK